VCGFIPTGLQPGLLSTALKQSHGTRLGQAVGAAGQAAAWEGARLWEQLSSGCSALHPEPWLPESCRRFPQMELVPVVWVQAAYRSFGHPNHKMLAVT